MSGVLGLEGLGFIVQALWFWDQVQGLRERGFRVKCVGFRASGQDCLWILLIAF